VTTNSRQGVHNKDKLDLAEACVRSLADAPIISIDTTINNGRGLLDSIALKHAHHDAGLHRHYRPEDSLAGCLFDVLEQERYEALGCNSYRGVQLNLDARSLLDTERGALPKPIEAAVAPLPAPSLAMLEQAIRESCQWQFRLAPSAGGSTYSDGSSAASASDQPDNAQQSAIHPLVDVLLPALKPYLHNQQGFAQIAGEALSRWVRERTVDNVMSEAADDQDVGTAQDDLEPLIAQEVPQDGSGFDNTEDSSAERAQPLEQSDQDAQHTDGLSERCTDESPGAGADPLMRGPHSAEAYKPYTVEFDEVGLANRYAAPAQLRLWREELDRHIALHARVVRRLAARLQRVLLARQRRHWHFDQEEGVLDSARLTRIIMNPMLPLSFKVESENTLRNTAITLLIDNSRSMLGRPMMIAAACTDILAQTLERCGVSVEILGYTTVHLHGGRSTELWESQGKPENPGRLNDLRHIIYKSADSPYRSSRNNLGLMLDSDILKQNIDGEALAWAHGRLMKRAEQRRILLVISDGAPVDISTLSANHGDYLAQHLQHIVQRIQKAGDVELLAIGIGHDVSRFYDHALSVFDAKRLGSAMLNELETLFRQVG